MPQTLATPATGKFLRQTWDVNKQEIQHPFIDNESKFIESNFI